MSVVAGGHRVCVILLILVDTFLRCEKNPLKVGAAFLRHESKFYLYALYNKNKPKSDSLMSEYGTSFFKVSHSDSHCTENLDTRKYSDPISSNWSTLPVLTSDFESLFWEQSKQLELNDKMDLASYLLKPVQRMGKYALLLQQLMKACSSIQVSGSNG